MSNLVFPVLPGLNFNNTRSPAFNTGIQQALSGKESRIAYMQYPLMTFELQYELRDYNTPSDLKAIKGLFMACGGKWDSFLFSDPAFNIVALMKFATTDGVSVNYQTTATYQNASGPGGAEIIQNFNGAPIYFLNRWGPLNELMSPVSKTNMLLQSQPLDNAAWSKSSVTATPGNTAPDGTITSVQFNESTNTAVAHYVQQTVTVPSAAAGYIFSAFVSPGAGSRSFCWLQLLEGTGSTTCAVWFNLSTGAAGTIQTGANWSGVSATIAPAGNGYYRISVTATKTNAATAITCYYGTATADAAQGYTGSIGTLAGYCWGAQFEALTYASQATEYVSTTTVPVTQTDYVLGATGIITTPSALAAGGALKWSGSFFYRCRFDDDSFTVSQFMNQLWENRKVVLRQVKL
jgi:hypothetical protein